MKSSQILLGTILVLGVGAPAHAQGYGNDHSSAGADTMDMATVTTATKAPYGAYLVDAKGRSLYLFTTDTRGSGKSTCQEGCKTVWPVLATEGMPSARGKARAALLGTIERSNGTTQVTYNGWPLYYYVRDIEPGDTKGQDVHSFGGGWYLVSPRGTAIQAE